MGTFNQSLGAQLQRNGMAAAASAKKELLEQVREAMKCLGRTRGGRECTIDDATEFCEKVFGDACALGPAAGNVFTVKKDWEFTGRWEASGRASCHAHKNRVWRLRDGR